MLAEISKARKAYLREKDRENYDRISFRVKKGERIEITAWAKNKHNLSVNAYLYKLIKADMNSKNN